MTVGGGGGQSALCARPGVRGVGAPPGRGRAQCVYVRGGMMDLLWVGEPQGCGQCQELSIWGSWGCRQLCVSVCVCVRACGSALEPLCTHRNVAPLGSPSCPGSTWKWPPGKGKGGEERGGGKKKKKKSPEPAIRRAQTQRQTKDSSSHPFPGEARGEARTSQAPSDRRRSLGGAPGRGKAPGCACLCVRGREHPPQPGALTEGRAAGDPGCALGPGPRRRGASARGIA